MHRLFVSLALPELAADALSQLQCGLPGARWRPEENFHLTLHFVGETDRRGLDDIHSALAAIVAPAFSLTLSGCKFFGDRKPRALWAGVATSPELAHLQSKVATALQRAGHPGEVRKFVPHVTLAGLEGVSRDAAEAFSASHSLFSFGPFPVDDFHLYESLRGGEGAHYEILATYPLSRSR